MKSRVEKWGIAWSEDKREWEEGVKARAERGNVKEGNKKLQGNGQLGLKYSDPALNEGEHCVGQKKSGPSHPGGSEIYQRNF